MFSAFLFLSYYLQQSLGYSSLKTGGGLPTVGRRHRRGNRRLQRRAGARVESRPIIPVGMLIAAAGMWWLGRLTVDSTYAHDVAAPLFILGFGLGLTFAPAISAATAAVEHRDAGIASAMVNTSQQIGGAVGTAALSTIFTSALTYYITTHQRGPQLRAAASIHGYTVAFHLSCALFAAGAVITALLLRSGRLPEETDP